MIFFFQRGHCSTDVYFDTDKISSTCSLPDEQYVHATYGDMIYDSRMNEQYSSFWYWEMSAFY